MMSSFLAVFRKEVLHIRRNRGVLIVTVMMPVMQMLLFGFIDQTVHDVPTVVVDQDHSVQSRELMDKLRATKTFDIREITTSPTAARGAIISGEAGVGIVIPPDYHDLRARNRPAKILVLIDGSDSTVSAGALAAINGLVAQDNLEILAHDARGGMPLAAQPIILFNPEGRTANYIIPGLVAILLQIAALVLASIAIVREREQGTMEQLIVTPIRPFELIVQARVEGIDVHRQLALAPEVVPDVFVTRLHVAGGHRQLSGERVDEALGVGGGVSVRMPLVGEQTPVRPCGLTVRAPVAPERPPRELFHYVPDYTASLLAH
jgi:ABC-2 type transport system permease protein